MTPKTATRPHPRVQERRVAVRRAQGRRRLRILLAALAAFTIAGGAWLLVNSSFLDVDQIAVEGAVRTRLEDVAVAAAVEPGEPLLLVDRGAVARRVERLPWVADATARWDLPGRLVIEIHEREAIAWIDVSSSPAVDAGAESSETETPEASEAALIDAAGRVLATRPVPPSNLVELRLDVDVPDPGGEISDADDAIELLAAMPRGLRGRIVALEQADGGGFRLSADAVEVIVFGPVRDVARKWAALEAVLRELGDREVYLVDLRAPAVPAVREKEELPEPEPEPEPESAPAADADPDAPDAPAETDDGTAGESSAEASEASTPSGE